MGTLPSSICRKRVQLVLPPRELRSCFLTNWGTRRQAELAVRETVFRGPEWSVLRSWWLKTIR